MKHTVVDPNKLYFVSDTHFGHKSMVEYWRRNYETGLKFKDTDDMNRYLIELWNETVPKDGIVFHLGDFAFLGTKELLEVREQLNGELHLVMGNHDQRIPTWILDTFASVTDYVDLKVKRPNSNHPQCIVLCHYAFKSWNRMHYGAWNLHGHSHGNLTPQGKQLDVGVDCTLVTPELRPLAYWEIEEYMNNKTIKTVDHHNNENKTKQTTTEVSNPS